MLFYLIVLMMICFTAIIFKLLVNEKNLRTNFYVIFWGSIFFVFYFLKDNKVGTDYVVYLNHFQNILPYDWRFLDFGEIPYPNFEKGYLCFTHIISLISQTDIFFTFVMALVMSVLPMISIRRFSNPVWIGIFLFFALGIYTDSFNILRQTIAMYICWLSISFIVKRALVRFLLVTLLAFSFHKTALVFIPVYFLFSIKFSWKFYVVAFVAIGMLYLMLLPLMSTLTALLSLNDYTEADVSGGYVFLLFMACCFVFCAYVLRKDTDPYVHVFMHMLFLAFILQMLATQFNILTRIIGYLKISLIVLLPTAIYSPIFKKNRLLILFLFVLLFIFYFYKTSIPNWNSAIPYTFR